MIGKNNEFSKCPPFRHVDKTFERVVSCALYDLMRNEGLKLFSVKEVKLSERKDSLRVYLVFPKKKEGEETLRLLNKRYASLVKKKLAESRAFSRIPGINFYSTSAVLLVEGEENKKTVA